jgi:hypothetical protein
MQSFFGGFNLFGGKREAEKPPVVVRKRKPRPSSSTSSSSSALSSSAVEKPGMGTAAPPAQEFTHSQPSLIGAARADRPSRSLDSDPDLLQLQSSLGAGGANGMGFGGGGGGGAAPGTSSASWGSPVSVTPEPPAREALPSSSSRPRSGTAASMGTAASPLLALAGGGSSLGTSPQSLAQLGPSSPLPPPAAPAAAPAAPSLASSLQAHAGAQRLQELEAALREKEAIISSQKARLEQLERRLSSQSPSENLSHKMRELGFHLGSLREKVHNLKKDEAKALAEIKRTLEREETTQLEASREECKAEVAAQADRCYYEYEERLRVLDQRLYLIQGQTLSSALITLFSAIVEYIWRGAVTISTCSNRCCWRPLRGCCSDRLGVGGDKAAAAAAAAATASEGGSSAEAVGEHGEDEGELPQHGVPATPGMGWEEEEEGESRAAHQVHQAHQHLHQQHPPFQPHQPHLQLQQQVRRRREEGGRGRGGGMGGALGGQPLHSAVGGRGARVAHGVRK